MSLLFRRLAALVAVLTLASTAAAQQPARASAPPDTSAATVVRAYFTAYNAHDIHATVALLAPDFVWLSVVGDSVAVEARGAEAIRAQLADYFRGLPSARSEIEGLTVLGPWVSVQERAHWTAASGPRSQASLSVYEVRDGRLRRVWYYPVVRESRP